MPEFVAKRLWEELNFVMPRYDDNGDELRWVDREILEPFVRGMLTRTGFEDDPDWHRMTELVAADRDYHGGVSRKERRVRLLMDRYASDDVDYAGIIRLRGPERECRFVGLVERTLPTLIWHFTLGGMGHTKTIRRACYDIGIRRFWSRSRNLPHDRALHLRESGHSIERVDTDGRVDVVLNMDVRP